MIVTVLAAACFATAAGSAAAAGRGRRTTRVSKRLGPRGGLVRLGGAAIYVPQGVMKKRGRVSVRRLRRGRVNFHIHAAWSGYVAITLPRVKRSEVIGHRISRTWLPEGRPGQSTVFVSRLSIFDTIKAKAKTAACFVTISRVKLLRCLERKVPGKVTKEFLSWLGEKLGENCFAAAASYGAGAPIGVLIEPACVGTAGEGEFEFPSGPPSTLPVTTNPGGPVQPPTFNPQGPTVDPQAPTPNPEHQPPPTESSPSKKSPAPSKPAPPKPYAGNLRVVVYGGGHVGVAFDVGWKAGRDPVTCHFFRDGKEVFTAQCGTYSSKQFYGVPAGTHSWYAKVSDRYGVYSDKTNTVVRYNG